MRQLQELFDKRFQDQLKLSVFVADIIENDLKKRDVHLTVEQKKRLVNELEKNQDNLNDNLSVQINDDGSIEITNKDGNSDFELESVNGAETKMKDILENLPSIINESSDIECEKYLAIIKEDIGDLKGKQEIPKEFQ